MNKKITCCILALVLVLCLFCGCDKAPAGSQSGESPGSAQDAAPEATPLPSARPTDSPQPEMTPTPEPQPEITPPADEPADPASGTDVIYESETLPPDPASDTDLDSD